MIDISSAYIKKLIVHKVGNKLRDDGCILSDQEPERSKLLDDLLLTHYLAPTIQKGDDYDFYHESNIELNAMHHFTNLIFEDTESFISHSQSIAKHLYSASTHPNITGGEFISILFENIETKNGVEQAIGIFKIEGRSDYLEVEENNGSFCIHECMGISLDKIQKSALIFSSNKKILVIDSLGQKTKYWIESFLKAIPSQTSTSCAKAAGAFIKLVTDEVSSPTDALKLNQDIKSHLSNVNSFSIEDIKKISRPYLDDEETMNNILSSVQDKVGFEIKDELEIDTTKLNRYTREALKKTKISEGINLVVQKSNARVSSVNVKNNTNGFTATIDIVFMEG